MEKKKKALVEKDKTMPDKRTPASHTNESEEKKSMTCFPIVGIGASAGGLAAFEAFFSGMPAGADPGMAFVLVQHLAPDHKSILTELVKRYTCMQVFEVEDGMEVKPNCAYIIPPNRDMAFINGTLHLLEPAAPRGQRLPIDFFFRSLAQDQRERAICIVLSGTGSDGTLGVRAIKGEGGMVMAQAPESTEYDGMPRNAIATGLVDFVLPPVEMPQHLIAYTTHAFGRVICPATDAIPKPEDALKKILILLRNQTGHDFSLYKLNTVNRRIDRRMAIHQIETIDRYVKYLYRTPEEVGALFRDLLIGVTSFFRDKEAFEALEKRVIPSLFKGRPAGSTVRVWTPGCSTGEEACSIAILLQEHIEELKQNYKLQIFATDIDSRAIDAARAGLYTASIASDISPERLERFFEADLAGSAYRIRKSIRDILVFSEQNVIKDPPFSRLDLISCRNLLIYMGGDLQKRLIPLFHYALKPGGFLFLGTSETVGEYGDLFSVLDRKLKIYLRRDDVHRMQSVALDYLVPPLITGGAAPNQRRKIQDENRAPLRELAEQALLQHVVLTGVIVDSNGNILFIHGRTGQFLEPAPGEVGVSNILKMAREGLRRELTTALHKAVMTKETVRHKGLRVKTNGDFTTVDLTVKPVGPPPSAESAQVLFLVILEESRELGKEQHGPAVVTDDICESGKAVDSRISALMQELRAKEEYLQTTTEQLQTSNEELKSSNEEMQSINEELQSTNEELETSKEELQSVNEELATVNAELQQKVQDLSCANNDMNNLLAGTGIGTIFVDHKMRIMRFTPTATQIINLILSDVGRPVGHIVSNLVGYDRLVEDAQDVLNTLIPKETEVKTLKDDWYIMRIMPYRTIDNVIEGVVITFVRINSSGVPVLPAAGIREVSPKNKGDTK